MVFVQILIVSTSAFIYRSQMWYLFKVITFITNLGAIHGAFRYQRSVNPETNMNISQIISYWGYPDEEYDIVTEDGYILGLYRIPYGKIKSDNNSDAGYDVWMGNSRGTIWSRKHLYLKSNSKEFWAFSFDEMAKYDLPASIEFIVKQTGQEKIFYVGYSQGTTIAFITFSTIPKIAERIKIHFALAPVFSVKYVKSPLIKMAYKWKSLIKVLFGNKDFLPNSPFTRIIGSKLCPQKIFVKICSRILFMMCGYDQKNLNMTTAPLYNVTNMNVSTATWNGANDLLADPEDVNILLSEIRNHIYHKTISHYSHIDFLFGLDVYHQVYREIIDIIQDHL
ncbi:lipase member J isoform 1-T1 [Molossus nigricans]